MGDPSQNEKDEQNSHTSPDPNNQTIELLKMEYDLAYKRYQSIYNDAIWKNFYYLAALSAALLTFGSSAFESDFLAGAVACIPLLLWYWVTFRPLDYIADEIASRLQGIEKTLNELVTDNETNPIGHFHKAQKERPNATPWINRVAGGLAVLCIGLFAFHFLHKPSSSQTYTVNITSGQVKMTFESTDLDQAAETVEKIKTTMKGFDSID